MNKLSSSELNTVIKILKKLEPGMLPFELFHQFARLYVTPIVEIVPLKLHSDGKITTILLRKLFSLRFFSKSGVNFYLN